MMWSVQDVSPLSPSAPKIFPLLSYKARPPAKTMTPPTGFPTSGSLEVPKSSGLPAYAACGFGGDEVVNPKRLPPGCEPAYRFAVDKAKLGPLSAFAVFAFSAAIILLPGHCAPRSGPLKVTAHTITSRFTTTAHI